ncbi:MAG: amidohydrolase family protein, partial [Candidatus Tectomicrobia bacterium]|nr:amidohydrolase family protein [Candidatus Tectomicrobia bacterium]
MSESLLIQGCGVLDPSRSGRIVEAQDILIVDSRIASIEATGNRKAGKVISGRDRLAIPGLINAHTHSAENYLKGINDRQPLEMWLPFIFGTAGTYSPRDVYLCCLIGAVEMLKTGSTSVIDHCWMSPAITPDRLDAAMEAYRDAGIRAHVAPLVSDTDYVDRYGGERGHP